MARESCISQLELSDVFVYDAGRLTWKISTSNRSPAGTEAGTRDGHGYISVKLNNRRYKAHRLIWEMFKGPIPAGLEIDHINRIRDDNRIENLRLATKQENARNQRKQTRATSAKYRGVAFHLGKWDARIKTGGKSRHIGRFDTEEEAALAYNFWAAHTYGEFAALNNVHI